jgi:hypothetical protein
MDRREQVAFHHRPGGPAWDDVSYRKNELDSVVGSAAQRRTFQRGNLDGTAGVDPTSCPTEHGVRVVPRTVTFLWGGRPRTVSSFPKCEKEQPGLAPLPVLVFFVRGSLDVPPTACVRAPGAVIGAHDRGRRDGTSILGAVPLWLQKHQVDLHGPWPRGWMLQKGTVSLIHWQFDRAYVKRSRAAQAFAGNICPVGRPSHANVSSGQ